MLQVIANNLFYKQSTSKRCLWCELYQAWDSPICMKRFFDFILFSFHLFSAPRSSFCFHIFDGNNNDKTKNRIPFDLLWMYLLLYHFRYGRWVTRRVAVLSIVTIWLLAALVSFVPISFGLHRPDQPLVYEDNGRKYPTCALDLTPTYAVVSSCISFYVPCIVMIGIYCR